MKKEFVTYEIALELKKLGFDEPCFANYSPEFNLYHPEKNYLFNLKSTMLGNNECKAPTFSQAFRWFREEYKIDAWVVPFKNLDDEKQYSYIIDELSFIEDPEDFYTYEEAELDCLKKLIEIVKDEK